MQQSSELMESIQTQVRAKRMATLEQQEKLKKSAAAAASATSSTASTTSVKSQQQQSWLEEPPRPYPLPPSSVLMPSATSADAFYTLANAAVRQHHIQVRKSHFYYDFSCFIFLKYVLSMSLDFFYISAHSRRRGRIVNRTQRFESRSNYERGSKQKWRFKSEWR